jgi:hypothetical protein
VKELHEGCLPSGMVRPGCAGGKSLLIVTRLSSPKSTLPVFDSEGHSVGHGGDRTAALFLCRFAKGFSSRRALSNTT